MGNCALGVRLFIASQIKAKELGAMAAGSTNQRERKITERTDAGFGGAFDFRGGILGGQKP